ncbi:hypothetical protein LOD99_15831 [Oopsacas minuta]|uniref:Uncharacterized protein n=1 Tax=Oopsacas minuta TaxID=111878 RepID=A0AAV7KB98_9METZ|nr:hypothetical protein LOD99_15831 [Oopsacas minuta]
MITIHSLQRRIRPNILLTLVLCLGLYILYTGDLLRGYESPVLLVPIDTESDYLYEIDEGLESLEGGPGDDQLVSDSVTGIKLPPVPREVHKGNTQGIFIGLKTEGSIVEGIQNFIELECIADLLDYRVILPEVSNGKYSTLHCIGSHTHSLSISHYFDITKTNVYLDSYSLPPFSNLSTGLIKAPPSVLLVFFVYSDDVIVFPHSTAGSFARDSLFPSEGPRNYVRDCTRYLGPLNTCVTRELSQLSGRQFQSERSICVDANLPLTRKQFVSYLGLQGEQKTVVLVNWNGMKPPNAPGAKATFLDVKNRFTSRCRPPVTVPFSKEIVYHSSQYLESWGLYPKDYVSVYIDLQIIMNELSNTTSCLEGISILSSWWYVAEYPNRLGFITSPDYVDYPDRQAVMDKYSEIENLLKERLFLGRFDPPEIRSNEGNLVIDHGFSFLVETNILAMSTGLIIAGPAILGANYPVRPYFYNHHVHDFDFVLHIFECI